jgi:hypothetical protein
MKAARVVADFGKAATALHKVLHQSIPLTHVQRDFIKTELLTLQTALNSYNSKNPEPDRSSIDEGAERIF